MRRWFLLAGVFGILATACGQERARLAPRQQTDQAHVNSASLLDAPPDLHCVGPGDDGTGSYAIYVYKGVNHKPARLVFKSDAALVGDYTYFKDDTPHPPTDLLYRYIFSDVTPPFGAPTVMVLEGGFTDEATALVNSVGGSDDTVVATISCFR